MFITFTHTNHRQNRWQYWIIWMIRRKVFRHIDEYWSLTGLFAQEEMKQHCHADYAQYSSNRRKNKSSMARIIRMNHPALCLFVWDTIFFLACCWWCYLLLFQLQSLNPFGMTQQIICILTASTTHRNSETKNNHQEIEKVWRWTHCSNELFIWDIQSGCRVDDDGCGTPCVWGLLRLDCINWFERIDKLPIIVKASVGIRAADDKLSLKWHVCYNPPVSQVSSLSDINFPIKMEDISAYTGHKADSHSPTLSLSLFLTHIWEKFKNCHFRVVSSRACFKERENQEKKFSRNTNGARKDAKSLLNGYQG